MFHFSVLSTFLAVVLSKIRPWCLPTQCTQETLCELLFWRISIGLCERFDQILFSLRDLHAAPWRLDKSDRCCSKSIGRVKIEVHYAELWSDIRHRCFVWVMWILFLSCSSHQSLWMETGAYAMVLLLYCHAVIGCFHCAVYVAAWG